VSSYESIKARRIALAINVYDLMEIMRDVPRTGVRPIQIHRVLEHMGQCVLCRTPVSMEYSPQDLVMQFFRDNFSQDLCYHPVFHDVYAFLKLRIMSTLPHFNPYHTEGIRMHQVTCSPLGYLRMEFDRDELCSLVP